MKWRMRDYLNKRRKIMTKKDLKEKGIRYLEYKNGDYEYQDEK